MIPQIGQDLGRALASNDAELEPAAFSIITLHHQLIRFGQNTMLAPPRPAQHLLVRPNAEKANVQSLRFDREVERGGVFLGRVNIVAVAGDAPKLDLLEGLVEVVER